MPRLSGALILTFAVAGGACGSKSSDADVIRIDGSSTVFPITQAVAEAFQKKSSARLTVGVSGTGGGFKKFCSGERDIIGASRPIKASEVALCAKNAVEYIELPVAYDGITVVVHADNDWVDAMTVAELKRLWEPAAQGKITRWSDLRDEWPDEEIHLFGAGVASGTYDYFTKAVVGTEHSSRGDFTNSEDDNVLVQGISTDRLALGFFGFAYFAENRDSLKVIAVRANEGSAAVTPSFETVADGSYQPLSRPIFLYVNRDRALRTTVADFVRFYVGTGRELIGDVGYIPLPDRAYDLTLQRFAARKPGSVFNGTGANVGVSVEELLPRTP